MVLDPFLGSGTTCIAALEFKRKSIGIEILHEYYNLSKSNIKKFIFLDINLRVKLPYHMPKLTYPEIFEYISSQIIKPFYGHWFSLIGTAK